jgi:HK97 family phage major capsid protein
MATPRTAPASPPPALSGRERRGQLLASCQAVVDRARAANRDLTDQEAETFDGFAREIDEIDAAPEEALARASSTDTPTPRRLTMTRSGLAIRTSAPVTSITAPAIIGEADQTWSYGAALSLMLGERDPEVDTGFVREIDAELRTRGAQARHGGFLVPLGAMMSGGDLRQKQIGTTPGGAGEALVTVDYRADLFGLDVAAMRARLIAGKMGAMVISSNEPEVVLPRQDQPLPAAQWLARDGSINLQTDLHTRAITLRPHTVAARHQLFRSARLYGTPSIYGLYQRQMVEVLNFEIDKAWLYGDATVDVNAPNGLVKQAAVQTYTFGTAGAAGHATLVKLSEMKALILLQPIESKRSWLMSDYGEGTLQTTWKSAIDPATGTETTATYGGPILDNTSAGQLLGYPYEIAKQIKVKVMGAVKGSDLWLDDWSSTGVCYFGPALELVPNIYGAAYGSGGIELIGFIDCDAFALDPSRFALARDMQLNQANAVVVP